MKKLFFAAFILFSALAAAAQTTDRGTVMSVVAVVGESAVHDRTADPQPAAAGQTQQPGYVRPDAKTRRNRYLKSMFGPWALGKTVLSAGISTWRNTPREWGGQWEGFGKRVASNMGHRIIGNTVTFGLDEAFRLDSNFYRSQKKDIGSRGNAIISSVTARKANGKRVFGFPRMFGRYTSNIVAAETWYPDRYSYKDGLRSGTISIGMDAIYNLITEFIRK